MTLKKFLVVVVVKEVAGSFWAAISGSWGRSTAQHYYTVIEINCFYSQQIYEYIFHHN